VHVVQGGSLTKPNMLLQPENLVGLRRNKMRKTTTSPDIIAEEITKSATATAATAEATTTAATAEAITTAATVVSAAAAIAEEAVATVVEATATAGPIEEPMTATEGPTTEVSTTLNNKEQDKAEAIVPTTEVVAMEAEEEIEEVEIKKEQEEEEEVKEAEVEQKKPEEMETRSFLSAQQKKADMIRFGGLRNAITSPVDGSSQTGRQARNRATTTTAAPTSTTTTATTITNRSTTTTENVEDPVTVQETTSSPSETVTEDDRHSSETTTVAEKEPETSATTATVRKMRKKPPTNATDDTSSHLETTLTSLRGRLERLQLLANSAGHRRPAAAANGLASETDTMAAFEFVKERTEPDRILIVYPNATVWPPLAAGGQQASKAAKEEEIEASASEIKFPR
jgi:hypothetical protein